MGKMKKKSKQTKNKQTKLTVVFNVRLVELIILRRKENYIYLKKQLNPRKSVQIIKKNDLTSFILGSIQSSVFSFVEF